MNNDATFKKKFKPALCTRDPVIDLIPQNEYHKIINVVRKHYREKGETYDEGCPKRHVCDGVCTGRPIHQGIPELEPYIKKLSHLIKPDGNIYLSDCSTCPIAKTCKSTCKQVSDFMKREASQEDFMNKLNPVSPEFDLSLGSWVSDDEQVNPGIITELIDRYGSIQAAIENLPWGSVNKKRQKLVRMYTMENKDFLQCAKEIGYANGNVARHEFYAALTTLSKYATVRFFLESDVSDIPDVDLEILKLRYYEFLTLDKISKKLSIPLGSVRSKIFRFLRKHGLKYSKYVRGTRVIPSGMF